MGPDLRTEIGTRPTFSGARFDITIWRTRLVLHHMQKSLIKIAQVLAGIAQGGVALATPVSYAMRQRRELPLRSHPPTGSRGVWTALFVPTVLLSVWEQAALPKPLSIPAILSNVFACGIMLTIDYLRRGRIPQAPFPIHEVLSRSSGISERLIY